MKTKRLFSVLILVVLLPLMAWADVWQDPETKVNYEFWYGDASVVESPEASGDITIPSKIKIPHDGWNGIVDYYEIPVSAIGDHAFAGCGELTSIAMDSVITIGEEAFLNCSKLRSVTIPSTVKTIGNNAFSGCNSLEAVHISDIAAWCGIEFVIGMGGYWELPLANPLSIAHRLYVNDKEVGDLVIPEGVTEIRASAFFGCSSLNSVTIPSSMAYIGDFAFAGCSALTSVHISDVGAWCEIQLGYVEANPLLYAGHLFLNGEEVTSLVIPEGVTTISSTAFAFLSNLINVSFPSTIESIADDAFYGTPWYDNLPEGLIYQNNMLLGYKGAEPTGDIVIKEGTIKIIDGAFSGCSGLTSVTIPEGVTSIGNSAFEYCSGLTSITIPEGVTSIGNSAFYQCSGLTSVIIPTSVTSIGKYAFRDCSGLTSITIPEGVTTIDEYTFGYCKSLTNVSLPSSLKSIAYGAFDCCEALTSVTIPEGVIAIGNSAFQNCISLSSVSFPSTIESVGYNAFYGTPWYDIFPEGLIYQNNMLLGYKGAKPTGDIVIKEGTIKIIDGAFSGCSGLTSITIPEGVTSIGNSAFSRCSGLTSVTIPEGVTSIGNSAFYQCSGLTSVTIPEGVTSIGNSAFYQCSGLTSITIPEGLSSIGNSVFSWCSGLTSVTIPEGVTAIGIEAFRECSSLASVSLPSTLVSIGKYAFLWCTKLSAIQISDVGAWCEIEYQDAKDNPLYTAKHLYLNGEEISGELVIPEGVTSIAPYAFYKCSGLTGITIPSSVTFVDQTAFTDCSLINVSASCKEVGPWFGKSIQELTLGEGVTTINEKAFSGCTKLASITIPSTLSSVGISAFSDCFALSAVYITDLSAWCGIDFKSPFSNPLATGPSNIGWKDRMLYLNGEEVKDLIIPDDVTSIGYCAFYSSRIRSCIIPESVTSIGDGAFYNCEKLDTVWTYILVPFEISINVYNITSNETGWVGAPRKRANTSVRYPTTLIVPNGTKQLYEATTGWNVFQNIVEIDEVTTAVENAIAHDGKAVITEHYALGGQHVSVQQQGLNIVRMSDGTVKKVVMK